MQKSKIAAIFGSFSKEDLNSFEKFLNSPFFPKRRDVKKYFEILKEYHPEFNISREEFYNRLFPGETHNERRFKNHTSQLIKMAEDFMVFDALKKNERLKHKLLAEEYSKRKRNKLFEQTIKLIEQNNSGRQFDSGEVYSYEQDLLWLKMENYNINNDYENSIKTKIAHTDYMTASFLIKYLRSLADKDAAISYNIEYDTPLIKTFSANIDFEKIITAPEVMTSNFGKILNVYYLAYKAVTDFKNEEHYFAFKSFLYENIELFSEAERFFLFNDLTSCCWNNRGAGNHKFGQEQMDIYKDMMNMDAWKSESSGYLSIVLYRNIMFMALVLRDYKWLEEFIQEHSSKMHPEYVSNMENFAWAHLYFETGRLNEALKSSSKVQYDFFVFKLDIKHLLLKIYYELNLFDQAFSLSDTYKHFLNETKEASDHHIKWHDGFIKIYMKILKAKSMENYSEAEFISKEFSETKYVIANKWIGDQIQILKEMNKK